MKHLTPAEARDLYWFAVEEAHTWARVGRPNQWTWDEARTMGRFHMHPHAHESDPCPPI